MTTENETTKEKDILEGKRIGLDYLHTHPSTQRMLSVDDEHVIVDRKDYEEVIRFLRKIQYQNKAEELRFY
ncbi:MAG: hypothetical protein WC979_01465 [Candidatus Pacearchaeota archaeon]|jgi:hypothetical protein|nr:hypothetical protein [Clostridia bacterium]